MATRIAQTADPVLCATCETNVLATRFTEPKAEFDPHCEACFQRDFTECQNCGEWRPTDELFGVETFPATRMEPAEYDEVCDRCGPQDGPDEPEYDPMADET